MPRCPCFPSYGLFTLMAVPLLSLSGSWFADDWYVLPAIVTLVTVKVTDFLVLRLRPGANMMHVPLPPRSPVVHVLDASAPAPFHVPTTVAPFND